MSVVFMRNKTSEYKPLYDCHLKYRSCLKVLRTKTEFILNKTFDSSLLPNSNVRITFSL